MDIKQVAIVSVGPGPNVRKLRDDHVVGLATSITKSGLMQPIVVRRWPADETSAYLYQVIAGHHRLEACKRAGLPEIAVHVVKADDHDAALISVTENFSRSDLTPAEKVMAFGLLKSAYEAKYPGTKAGVAGGKARQGTATGSVSFAKATADTLGVTERTIRRFTELFTRLGRETLESAARTSLDSYPELDALADLDADRRASLLERAGRLDDVSARAERARLESEAVADVALAPDELESKTGLDLVFSGHQSTSEEEPNATGSVEQEEQPNLGGVTPGKLDLLRAQDSEDRREMAVTSPHRATPGLHGSTPDQSIEVKRTETDSVSRSAPDLVTPDMSTGTFQEFLRGARQRLRELEDRTLSTSDTPFIRLVESRLSDPTTFQSAEWGADLAEAYLEFILYKTDVSHVLELEPSGT